MTSYCSISSPTSGTNQDNQFNLPSGQMLIIHTAFVNDLHNPNPTLFHWNFELQNYHELNLFEHTLEEKK